MAKVVVDEQRVVARPWWDRSRIVFIGAGLGVLWWIVSAILRKYVVEPLACRDLSTTTACVDSYAVAGNIALVITLLVGMVVLVRSLLHRPVIITVASAIVLWGLGGFIAGLAWYESLGWAALLFALSYTLFSLVARISLLSLSIIVGIVSVAVIRVLLAL